DYDVEARTVEGEIFPSRPEADNVRKSIDEFERSFDESLYKKSEEHARRAMENLTSYDSKYPLVAKHVEAKKKEVEKALKEFDLKARTITYRVNTRTFDTREEAEKAHHEAFVINGVLQGLNYEESEADAKEALRKLEGYTPECRIVFDDYMKKLQDLLNSFDREASTVSFSERSIVLEREEAEKVKAMPEFSELVSGWEKYKTERTDGRLSHIADLLQKMPQKIRESYWGMMSEFEASKKKTADRAKIRIGLKSFLWYVAAVAGLVFFARYWQGWEWVGLKGVAAAFMLIVPIIAVVNEVNENGSSTDENPNLGHDLITVLLLIYWGVAFLSLIIPSWDSYSTALRILIGIAVLIIVGLIGSGIEAIPATKKKAAENARKAIEYLKDFEQLSSQSTEYRNFKMTNKK
ncbi:MAG: hypothetical protein IJ587_12230, partial [Synergistaceae bacterium]|nr:hypothetical protein [Synergistaceae bacterium]